MQTELITLFKALHGFDFSIKDFEKEGRDAMVEKAIAKYQTHVGRHIITRSEKGLIASYVQETYKGKINSAVRWISSNDSLRKGDKIRCYINNRLIEGHIHRNSDKIRVVIDLPKSLRRETQIDIKSYPNKDIVDSLRNAFINLYVSDANRAF